MGTPINMGVSEEVLAKVGAAPELDGMSKDDLANLCKQLYDRACGVFGEKFDEEYQMKKRDMEIHNLEMETSESHGTSGILLKLGGYGIIRLIPVLNPSSIIRFLIVLRCLGGGLLGIVCTSHRDIKVIIAYSSVVHMAFIILGVLSYSI